MQGMGPYGFIRMGARALQLFYCRFDIGVKVDGQPGDDR